MPATLPNERSTHTKETGGSRKTEGFAGRNEEGGREVLGRDVLVACERRTLWREEVGLVCVSVARFENAVHLRSFYGA
jgi:hypothetical protein